MLVPPLEDLTIHYPFGCSAKVTWVVLSLLPLEEEDVIVQMGDEPIRNTGELSKFLIAHPPGETVSIVYFRGSKEKTTQVTFAEQPKG